MTNVFERFEPNFIGIGMQKCGTTWLAKMLSDHPEVGFARDKETNFFNEVWPLSGKSGKSKLETEGIDSYRKYFSPGRVVGEWSVTYAPDPYAAELIKQHFPNVKIIASLRNPIDRSLSSYNFGKYATLSENSGTFEEAIRKHPAYIEESLYYPQLKRYFDLFPRENIKTILLDDIEKDSRAVLKDLYRFLEVDDSFVPRDIDRKITVARKVQFRSIYRSAKGLSPILKRISPPILRPYARVAARKLVVKPIAEILSKPLEKEPMEEETRENLREVFTPDIVRTGKLVGRNLSAWYKPA